MDPMPLVRALEDDVRSGASELLPKAIALLQAVVAGEPESLAAVARAVGEAQPSMAPLWNAALAALREARHPGALERFDVRRRRAASAVTRVAVETLRPASRGALRVVTLSFSGTVLACLRALGERCEVRAACAEGRPALEGRRMAAALVSAGIDVRFYSDAGIGEALGRADGGEVAVLLGADAVTPGWVVNKVGSAQVSALAARRGVPVYVAAGREKFADRRVARLIRVVEHEARELWEGAPAGVGVTNRYFEMMPADLVSGIVSDAGVLDVSMLDEACRAASAEVDDEEIARLGGAPV